MEQLKTLELDGVEYEVIDETARATTSNHETRIAAAESSLDTKVDKVTGKGLSTEDYTTAEKTKLAGISPTYWEKVWTGGLYLDNRHTVNFTGSWKTMRLIWSQYNNGAAQDYDWQIFEIPYHFAADHPGNGVSLVFGQRQFSAVAVKYVYVRTTYITGNESNAQAATTSTATGITYNNARWVLREVWLERYTE